MGNDSQAYTYSGGPCRSLPYIKDSILEDARKHYKLLLRLAIGVHMLSQHLHAA